MLQSNHRRCCLLSKLHLPTKILFLNMFGFEILYCGQTNNEYQLLVYQSNFYKIDFDLRLIFTFQNCETQTSYASDRTDKSCQTRTQN
jgi:hypothetical protein